MNRRIAAATCSALTITALLAGGSTGIAFAASSPSPMSSSSTMMSKGSKGDISFTQMMVPHHQQAVQMADLALKNAKSQQVITLATQIKAAQKPEINKMQGWLKGWGASVTASSNSTMPGMDMGSTSPGMMTDTQMTNLSHAHGASFDTMWLQMMIAHHQGAITDAKQVLKTTKNADVKKMAQAIISGQNAEISTMKQLLAK
ncbi:MAG: DUF305 domain-containing protein [Candidatus Nanopelagicales bacterium]|nr:DUF305 domain-containing protein [Candidatus Nanopelagicales bacterium]